MKSRLDNIPINDSREVSIRARDYNLIKIALKRLASPLRIELPGLRTVDFILENDLWVIVDRSLNDIPVIAWLNFNDKNRTSLHEEIVCQRRTYNAHALIIIDKAFAALHLILSQRIKKLQQAKDTENTVIQFTTHLIR